MNPKEIYKQCSLLMKRKIDLEKKLKKKESLKTILAKEFPYLATEKPYIFKNLLSGDMSLEQFKQFAESAQCIMGQLNSTSSSSGPPKPVVFD